MSVRLDRALGKLRAAALLYPEAVEDFPWGECTVKVRGRIFVFLSRHDGGLSVSTKLPHGSEFALLLPFASPTGYGLGRSGWVTARFDGRGAVPVPLLMRWIDESYRAVAPRRLVATLTGSDEEKPAPARRRRR